VVINHGPLTAITGGKLIMDSINRLYYNIKFYYNNIMKGEYVILLLIVVFLLGYVLRDSNIDTIYRDIFRVPYFLKRTVVHPPRVHLHSNIEEQIE
jgi:hypothetical protein